jgi:hypothetical protein
MQAALPFIPLWVSKATDLHASFFNKSHFILTENKKPQKEDRIFTLPADPPSPP